MENVTHRDRDTKDGFQRSANHEDMVRLAVYCVLRCFERKAQKAKVSRAMLSFDLTCLTMFNFKDFL